MPGRQPFCGKGEPALRAMYECCRGCPRGDSPGVASELRGAPKLTCPPASAALPPAEAGTNHDPGRQASLSPRLDLAPHPHDPAPGILTPGTPGNRTQPPPPPRPPIGQ